MDFVERLAVGIPDGPYSASLRVWSPPGKSDVYAGIRERAGEHKVSLHSDGRCLSGLTKNFADSEPVALAALGGSRHQSNWMRRTHLGSQFTTPLQFAFPHSELRTWRTTSKSDASITWIAPPRERHSVIVTCGFSGQLIPDHDWPGKWNGTELLGVKILPNGEKFWLFYQYCPTSETELSMLAESKELLSKPGMVHFSGVDANSPPPPRYLIFKHFPEDRLLVVIDSAA